MNSSLAINNPYLVLELDTRAGAMDAERSAKRLLGLLEIGAARASKYWTPWGEQCRDAHTVKEALNAFREPSRRMVALLWAPRETQKGAASRYDASVDSDGEQEARSRDAFRTIGWSG